MGSDAFLFGIVVLCALLATMLGIRYKVISAKIGFIAMLVIPFLINTIIVKNQHGSVYEMICVGSLLSLAFGPATYVAGRWLEKRFRNK